MNTLDYVTPKADFASPGPAKAMAAIAIACWLVPLMLGLGALAAFTITGHGVFGFTGLVALTLGVWVAPLGLILSVLTYALSARVIPETRTRLRKRAAYALIGIVLNVPIAIGCVVLVTRSPSARSAMGITLPSGCKVINEHTRRAGLDISYAMEIAYNTEADVESIVQQLGLAAATTGGFQDPISFISGNPPSWWPSVDTLPVYDRVITSEERYWTLWVDRERKRMYLERGRW